MLTLLLFTERVCHRMCWYVAEYYVGILKSLSTSGSHKQEPPPQRVLEGLIALADFLMGEIRLIESNAVGGVEPVGRREAKEMVPPDRVKDPSALAREFRWRVRFLVNDGDSGDEGFGFKASGVRGGAASKARALLGQKRKRGATTTHENDEEPSREGSSAISIAASHPPSIFKHYEPRAWDSVLRSRGHTVRKSGTKPLAVATDLKKEAHVEPPPDRRLGTLETRADTVMKFRKLEGGRRIERETVTRVIEIWTDDAMES